MPENVFEELKRYVRFDAHDQALLRAALAAVEPRFTEIVDAFYERVLEHPEANQVLSGPAQVARLKGTLCLWMRTLFDGPWDHLYYERRLRIGRVHVAIYLPQRYMFGAMNLIRAGLIAAVEGEIRDEHVRAPTVRAIEKIVDIELAIMLESYEEAFIDRVQQNERAERAELRQRLELSEARYDEVVERGEALITTCDWDCRILLFNGKCEQLTGISRQDARGLSWLEVFVVDADRPAVEALHAQVLRGVLPVAYEGPVAVSQLRRRVRWHFTTLPGPTRALCAIGIDVTAEHDLSVRSRRSERLAALGTMAAGLAHEIRNPLNAAYLQLNVARRRLARTGVAEADSAFAAVTLAESEMKRLAGLVEDFLQFARPQPLRLAQANLRETAQVIVALLGPEAATQGTSLVLEDGPAVVLEMDDEKMKQVLLNLVRNAVEAAGAGGHVRVGVQYAGALARLTVEDDGGGLPPDAPLFEPFFTTKEQGTGLGLSIVHRIVTDHRGAVDVESRPGRTSFRISLPMTPSTVA